MRKATVKRFSGSFLKLINLTAVICILSLIADIARTKTAWHGLPAREKTAKMAVPLTLLNTTITNAESTRLGEGRSRSRTGGSLLNKSVIKAESRRKASCGEPHRPENTTKKQTDNSEGNAKPPRFLPKGICRKASCGLRIAKARAGGEWQSIQMRVTAYCPCPKCCGQYSDGVTACGHKIQPGDTFVAADGRYAFGTEMLIPGYNNSQPVQVLDRGGAIKGNKLDVFFNSHEEALEWGVRHLDVRLRGK